VNLLLLDPSELGDDSIVVLADHRVHHLQTVLGVAIGTKLRAGVLDQSYGEAWVVDVSESKVTIEYVERRPVDVATPRILILALPRPKVLSRCLAHAAALGFTRIALVRCQRSDKGHLSSSRLESSRIRRDCLLGLEQGGHVVVPVVSVFERFKPFVEDSLQEFTAGTPCFAAHLGAPDGTTARSLLEDGSLIPTLRYTLAIGPEGGFVPYEAELLVRHGFRLLSSRAGALRVESALSYFSGQLDVLGSPR
jgi:RsmE family RNA methyltransferase